MPAKRARPPSIPLLFAMMFAGQLGTTIYLPGLPDIARDLDTSISAAQSMIAIYLGAFGFAQLVMGPLSDRFGRRPVMITGLAIFAVASAVCASAPDIVTLLVARVFQAVGACATMVVGRAMIRDTSEGVAAAQAMAWLAIAIGTGPAIAPFAGGFIVSWFGWQASFTTIGLVVSVVLGWVVVSLEETLPPEMRSPPRASQLLITYVRLIRNPVFLGYSMIVAFASGAMQAYLTSVPIVFIVLMDVPLELFGFYVMMMPTLYIIASYVSRQLSFHIPIDRIVLIGCAMSATGGLLQVILGLKGVSTPPPVLFAFAISNFGTGLVLSIGYAQALNTVTPSIAGQASALSGFLHMGWGAGLSFVVAQLHHTSSLQLGISQMTTTWLGAATALYLIFVVKRARD
jgi:DHA1 family bicyclomycin/chloramphenicol resistance-like MFS transporter